MTDVQTELLTQIIGFVCLSAEHCFNYSLLNWGEGGAFL